jgi:hypothetical protein
MTMGRLRNIDKQKADVVEPEETEVEEVSEVEETPWGVIKSGTFPITVKDETGKKVLYENKKEPFKYPQVVGLGNAIVYFGGTMSDKQLEDFATVIGDSNGPQVKKILDVVNTRLRTDAKIKSYQQLVTKHKPLEGENLEVAIAKMIRQFTRVNPAFSVDTVITILKGSKAIPADYTVDDYNSTPLRKTRGAKEEDDEDED